MQTAVLSGGNASTHYSGLPLRGCCRRLDFELVACLCVILLLAPSLVILVYDYYKVGDSLYKTAFLSIAECRNISHGDIAIVEHSPAFSISYGANFNLSCRANKAAYWQWFKNGVAFKQLTDTKIERSCVSLRNITSSASFCCMSFLADPFCDVSTDIPVHVKGGGGSVETNGYPSYEVSSV